MRCSYPSTFICVEPSSIQYKRFQRVRISSFPFIFQTNSLTADAKLSCRIISHLLTPCYALVDGFGRTTASPHILWATRFPTRKKHLPKKKPCQSHTQGCKLARRWRVFALDTRKVLLACQSHAYREASAESRESSNNVEMFLKHLR
jgi:hypothetical protein